MYVSETGRGGILEPEGIMEIKYKQKDRSHTMNRLGMAADKEISKSIMHQMAIEFVDLHDQPAALKANQVIRHVVEWKNSRRFFYKRLKRLLVQNGMRKRVAQKLGSSMDQD